MAVATEDRTSFRQVGQTRRYDMVAGAETIYKGTLVNRDGSGDATPAADTAALELLGVATEQVVAATGASAGDNKVKVWTEGFFEFVHSGLTQANVGANVYVVDDTTVDLIANVTNSVFVGRVVDVPSATAVVVSIFVRGAGSAGGVAAIIDSSGGAAANGTIEAVTPPAAITDSSGGVDPGDDIIAAVTNVDTLTDSTGGTADDTVAADAGKVILGFHIQLPLVVAGDVVTDYIPGFAGTIDKVTWIQGTPVTTGSKNADLVVDVEATEISGGIVDLDLDAIAIGVVVEGTAVTGGNAFTAAEKISIRGETVTTFTEGDGTLYLVITPTDVNDNFKEITDQIITQEAANTAILAAVSQLAAKQNVDRTAIIALTDAVTELATKVNEIIAT